MLETEQAPPRNLLASLVQIQAEIEDPIKTRINTYHNNAKYADLPAVLQVIRPVFSKYGVAINLTPVHYFSESGAYAVGIDYLVSHAETGEAIKGCFMMPLEKPTAQNIGSALTYLRRYVYCVLAGIAADDDDDGNKASDKQAPVPQAKPQGKPQESKPVPKPDAVPTAAPIATPAKAVAPATDGKRLLTPAEQSELKAIAIAMQWDQSTILSLLKKHDEQGRMTLAALETARKVKGGQVA